MWTCCSSRVSPSFLYVHMWIWRGVRALTGPKRWIMSFDRTRNFFLFVLHVIAYLIFADDDSCV